MGGFCLIKYIILLYVFHLIIFVKSQRLQTGVQCSLSQAFLLNNITEIPLFPFVSDPNETPKQQQQQQQQQKQNLKLVKRELKSSIMWSQYIFSV